MSALIRSVSSRSRRWYSSSWSRKSWFSCSCFVVKICLFSPKKILTAVARNIFPLLFHIFLTEKCSSIQTPGPRGLIEYLKEKNEHFERRNFEKILLPRRQCVGCAIIKGRGRYLGRTEYECITSILILFTKYQNPVVSILLVHLF